MEDSVPPGFASKTSFTLKRADDIKESYNEIGYSVPKAQNGTASSTSVTLKASATSKAKIFYDHCFENQEESFGEALDVNLQAKDLLPKGIDRGCVDCPNCQKVTGRWRPESACIPVLEVAPIFFPTEEEFEDIYEYITRLRQKAELYGMCRIVPPASWKSPSLLLEEEVRTSFRFKTKTQRIDELKNRYFKGKAYKLNEVKRKKRKRHWTMALEFDSGNGSDEGRSTESTDYKYENGPDLTLKEFEKYADDFKGQYFCKKGESIGSNINLEELWEKWDPSVKDIEGEYWRIVENPTEQIEVLYGADLERRDLRTEFPVCEGSMSSSLDLDGVPQLPNSLLSFENSDTSNVLEPRLRIGMCFSSTCWEDEEHHLYSLCYMHLGAPKIWYSIPGGYALKFKAALQKHFPKLSEQPVLLHELVMQVSPSLLKSEGIPVYRCTQFAREFVVMFPGAHHSEVDCGFNCTETVNFAPIGWLPHGQNVVELYREQGRRTSISHDKLLFGAAMEAVRALWEISFRERKTSENLRWKDACGKDGILTKTLRSRIKFECLRRECLCGLVQSRMMDRYFDAYSKKECYVCFYDLHLTAVGCVCSPDKYSCLTHALDFCCCPWSERIFLFRYDTEDLNVLVEALEGKFNSVYKWAKVHLGLGLLSNSPAATSSSVDSKSQSKARVFDSRSYSDLSEQKNKMTSSSSGSSCSADDIFLQKEEPSAAACENTRLPVSFRSGFELPDLGFPFKRIRSLATDFPGEQLQKSPKSFSSNPITVRCSDANSRISSPCLSSSEEEFTRAVESKNIIIVISDDEGDEP